MSSHERGNSFSWDFLFIRLVIDMKKVLAAFCYIAELACMTAAALFSYRAYKGELSLDIGLVLFVLPMIVSYWFSTFFYQLTTVKDTDGNRQHIINRYLAKTLSVISNLITFALVGFWIYIFLFRSDFNRTLSEWLK